ncbi:hypothetical protein V8C86DRAFT_2752775 [Haematococcus lacustris]
MPIVQLQAPALSPSTLLYTPHPPAPPPSCKLLSSLPQTPITSHRPAQLTLVNMVVALSNRPTTNHQPPPGACQAASCPSVSLTADCCSAQDLKGAGYLVCITSKSAGVASLLGGPAPPVNRSWSSSSSHRRWRSASACSAVIGWVAGGMAAAGPAWVVEAKVPAAVDAGIWAVSACLDPGAVGVLLLFCLDGDRAFWL